MYGLSYRQSWEKPVPEFLRHESRLLCRTISVVNYVASQQAGRRFFGTSKPAFSDICTATQGDMEAL